MALFGMEVKSRGRAKIKGFNPQSLNDRTAIRQRKQLGLLRTMFSGLSLLFGGGMIYVALHYIPAFVQPKQVLQFATGDSAAMKTYDFDRTISHLDNWCKSFCLIMDVLYDLIILEIEG